MVFNATFNNISATVYRGGQIYWWSKPEYPEKTADANFVIHADFFHIILSFPKKPYRTI
jgi:hypothetical protein